jgi:dephospho-CoA kinase
MIFTVGLTGGIGCGKSSVARMFAERGATVVDTDLIAHELTQTGKPALAAIRSLFGAEVFQPEGALDRTRLRLKVFGDTQARKKLEGLLHPLIRSEALRQLTSCNTPYALLVVPLLLETGNLREQVQRVLVIDCDEAQQIARTVSRSRWSEDEVRSIMQTQIDRATRRKHADDILLNDGSLEQLNERVDNLHHRYLELAARYPASLSTS